MGIKNRSVRSELPKFQYLETLTALLEFMTWFEDHLLVLLPVIGVIPNQVNICENTRDPPVWYKNSVSRLRSKFHFILGTYVLIGLEVDVILSRD